MLLIKYRITSACEKLISQQQLDYNKW